MPRKNSKNSRKKNRFDVIEINGKNFRIDQSYDNNNIIHVIIPLSRRRLSEDDEIALYRKASYKGITHICINDENKPLSEYCRINDHNKELLLTA
jgi:hypothetical protein